MRNQFVPLKITSSEKGFTLIELLFVAVMLALLASVLYGTLRGIARTKEIVEDQGAALGYARDTIQRISNELHGKVAEPLVFPDSDSPNQRRLYFVGIDKKDGDSNRDILHFTSGVGAQAVMGASGNFGRVQISYRLEETPEAKDNTAENAPQTFTLVREEFPAGVRDQDILDKRRIVFPIAKDVISLNFRYFFGGRWNNEWTGTRRPFPEVIEISLQFLGADSRVESFKSAVALSKRPSRRASSPPTGDQSL